MSNRRQYHSELRARRADDTRRRIRRAARELFVENGIAETTIAEIAKRASVSTPTVYTVFESKAGLVAGLLDELEETGLPSGLTEMLDERDPHRQLELWVAAHCALFDASADILRLVNEGPAEVGRPLAAMGNERRRQVIDTLTKRWSEANGLASGLSRRQASEQMWLLTTTESYLFARDELGWSSARYRRWLIELLRAQILGTRP